MNFKYGRFHIGALAAMSAAWMISSSQAGAQCTPAFTALGVLPAGTDSSAAAVSADGSTVVGKVYTPSNPYNGPDRAFRWTRGTGMDNLSTLPGDSRSYAYGVSGDGSIVVGTSGPFNSQGRAFRWTAAGIEALPPLPGDVYGWAQAVSADGTTIVGESSDANSGQHPVRWTLGAGGETPAAFADPCCLAGWAQGVSADGSVIVGIQPAFRWTASSGVMMFLGASLSPPFPTYCCVNFANEAISGNGAVSVGLANMQVNGGLAWASVRWNSDGTATVVTGPETGVVQYASGANDDGSVIVGTRGGRAFVWTPAWGALDLQSMLAVLGGELDDWTLTLANSVSASGNVIVGEGVHGSRTEAWVAFVPVILTRQPAPSMACPHGAAQFSVSAAGENLAYQWQIETAPGVWNGLGNDPFPLPCGGGAFAYASPIFSPAVNIGVRPCPSATPGAPQHFQIRCVVSNACGSTASNEATYTICPADFNCSGSVTVADIFAFLSAWFAGDASADFNGSGGAPTVSDIFAYLSAWFAGC